MKKILKILSINLILILLSLILFEFGCAYFSFNHNKNEKLTITKKLQKTIKYSLIHYKSQQELDYKKLTRNNNLSYPSNRPHIILTGCSFTYGDGLSESEAFHSVLAKETKTNVINLGICCASPRETLDILKNEKTRNTLLNNISDAEYVIYTYIPDHKKRLYTDVCQFRCTPYFKPDKTYSHLTYSTNKDIHLSFAYSYFASFWHDKYLRKYKYDEKLLFLYLKEINSEVRKNFKNSKGKPTQFVILIYEDDNENWDVLKEKNGIIIIDLDQLTGVNLSDSKYRLADWHPNAKAWEVIVPVLAKELNL